MSTKVGRNNSLTEGWDLDGREVSTTDDERARPKSPDKLGMLAQATDTLSYAAALDPTSTSLPPTPHPSPASPADGTVVIAMGVVDGGGKRPASPSKAENGSEKLLVKKECFNFDKLCACFSNCFKCLREFGKKEN